MTQSGDQTKSGNSNFAFIQTALLAAQQSSNAQRFIELGQELLSRAQSAEASVKTDPRIAGFYARNTLELMVEAVFDLDNWLQRPGYDKTLMSLIHDKDFKQNLSHGLFPKLKLIIKLGNEAVHGKSAFAQRDALQAVKELHHVLYWFVRTYTPGLDRQQFVVAEFEVALIPDRVAIDAKVAEQALSSIKQVQALQAQLAEQDEKNARSSRTGPERKRRAKSPESGLATAD